ncbi:hypothetical protein GGI23_001536 [Coemansia sp. RSA 2559]|nr:hypothetical protein GGI23_001536 [Coemansia sp. RSA 2559]
MSSSKDHLHTTPTGGRSASGASARPRRTSYECGNLARDSSADEHVETDSDTNPYARKRYKSVRSIVAQAYPRRRPRRQSGSSAPTPPRTRRSSSYNDASSGGSAASQVSPTGAGKWRPSSHSDDESDHGSITRESRDEDVGMVDSDGDESDHHYGLSATTDQTLVSSKGGRPRRRRQGSDSASALGTAIGRRRNDLAVDVKTFTPPPPNTTPRASVSPDRTPYPPATSPSFHHLRRSKRDSDASSAAASRSSRHKSSSSGELQIASPLLLPRGMVSLPLDGGSIFGTSAIADAALNVEPIAASSSYISPEASLRHFTPTPMSTSTLEGMQTDETHVDMHEDDAPCSDRVEPSSETHGVGAGGLPLKDHQKSEAVPAQDGEAVKSPESVSVKTEQSIDSSDMELSGGSNSSSNGGFDFTFHDLMDAELMSLNELDKLWTNSNPMSSSYLDSDTYASRSMLEPIPEVTMEDSSDIAGGDVAADAAAGKERSAGDSRVAAVADSAAPSAIYAQTKMLEAAAPNGGDDDHRELSTRLTQKLLALKAGSVAAERKAANHAQQLEKKEDHCAPLEQGAAEPTTATSASSGKTEDASNGSDAKPMDLDSVEPTNVLAKNSKEHEETVSASSAAKSNRVVLPDPFADIPPTAMVATKVPVSPRIVLTIVETVPVYMTVITTTEPAADCQGKWIVRRHRLLRLVENGYVNASSLLLSGGVASEQERSIVLSLEVGRFKWRRPQSKLYGTWIPLPRARALAATCSLNHRLGPFLNDNLEAYFPAPLPTSFIRHLIMPFFSDSAGILLSPAQPELDATSAAFSSDANALLVKGTPTSEAAAATGEESGVLAESSEATTAEASESVQANVIMPAASSHPVVTSTALSSMQAKASGSSTTNAASALFGSGLGIGIQNMANSAMASYAQSLLRQPKQSISRSSTFGATARGTPSPSIIQSLATRGGGGALNFAGAAKAIFGSDDKQLQSFLQLLSTESPMLSTSNTSELQADSHSPQASRAGSPAGSSAEAATTSVMAVAPEAQDAGDPSLIPSPFGTKPEVRAMINGLAKSTLADGDCLASLVQEAFNKTGCQVERADASNATAEDSPAAMPASPGGVSTASGTRSNEGDVGGSDDPKPATAGLLSIDAKAEAGIASHGADQKKDTDGVAKTEATSLDNTRFDDSMDVDSAEQSEDNLELRMVFSADDDDMDMICRSTPPSPPPPPHTLPRLRKLSSTPLLLSRPGSPTLSESMSSVGDHALLDDQGHEHLTKQQQHGIGSFNARLAQSMEAFGFTGTAKASLLLRLRAAAAAKSTGRQQAVAPYMLYRSSGAGAGGVGIAATGTSGASNSGLGVGGHRRSKLGVSDMDINGVLAGGVRKRARVIRVSRAKPVPKQAAAGGAGTSSSAGGIF